MSQQRRHSISTQLKQALAGGIAGAVTRFITQPLDVLKIRFQMQVEPLQENFGHTKPKYYGIRQAIHDIYHEEGLRGLWRGHNAGQMMSITYALVQFWSYEQLRQAMRGISLLQEHPNVTYFLCGGTAGCLGAIISQPFDTIRTRVVASDQNSASSETTSMRGALKIGRREGIYPLFRGLGFTLAQIYPLVGANFLFYKNLNYIALKLLKHVQHPNEFDEKLLPSWMLFITGGIAGTLAKAIVYPCDLLKKRIQLNHFTKDRTTFGENAKCPTVLKCVRFIVEMEGYTGFYKGMAPTLLKSGVTSAVYFGIYDNVTMLSKKYWSDEEQSDKDVKKQRKRNISLWTH